MPTAVLLEEGEEVLPMEVLLLLVEDSCWEPLRWLLVAELDLGRVEAGDGFGTLFELGLGQLSAGPTATGGLGDDWGSCCLTEMPAMNDCILPRR